MFHSKFIKIVGVVTILNILAKLFGFLREITIGYIYGTTYEADAIITAFTIPNFLYVVIGGAINTAFISAYSKMDDSKGRTFAQSVYTILIVISMVITIFFLLFPRFWMDLFFGGMSPAALDLTSKLFLVTAPATFFLIVSMLFSGLHNVHGNYRFTTFATLLFNAVYVIIGLVLTPVLSTYSYALGASLASFSILFILAYQIRKKNLASLKPKITKMPELKKLLYLALPLILGGATMHFYLIIQRIFAAGLEEGTISAVNYASKITQLPRGVLMASVTTIIYPMLAKAAGDHDFDKIDKAYKQGFRMLIIVLVPATMFLFVYGKEIITLVFEYGNFSTDSTNFTYPLLQIFAFSVFSLSLNTYITRFYYAMENTLLPNLFNVISVFGVNILIILLLIDRFGAAAIAYGTVISAVFNMLLLIGFAKVKFDLIISSWKSFINIALFIVVTIATVSAAGLLPIQSAILMLLIGGLVTVSLIGLGLKVVK